MTTGQLFGGGKPSSFIGNRYRHEPVNDAELCTARLPIKAVNTGLGKNAQDETVPLTLKDRRTHVYVVGKTGQGKSVLLENMMIDDLAAGRGFAFLDPHGTSAERIADCIPNDRLDDVIYFDPAALRCPSFNPLDTDDPDLTAEQIVTTIHDIFPSSWGPNLEYILYNDLRLLLENPGTTLLDLKKVLVNKPYRLALLAKTKDDDLRSIWEDEFAAKNEKQWNEEIRSTLNKIGRITSVRSLRRVLGGPPTLDFKDIMDEGKILICNLSVGKLGRGASRLLGALIVSGFVRAAESRTGKPRDFGLYADEFQNFFTESFDSALSEARKWRLGLVLAHQFVGQLPESLRQAILGNVGTLIAFQAALSPHASSRTSSARRSSSSPTSRNTAPT